MTALGVRVDRAAGPGARRDGVGRCLVEEDGRTAEGRGPAVAPDVSSDRRAWAEPLLAGIVVSLIAEAKDAGWSGRLEYVVEMCAQEMTSSLGMTRQEIVQAVLRWAGELGEDLTREDVEKALAP
ncbi:MAG TPA: hypothetical protein VK881_03000 [bacterium]|nr:hypothetical protein [bacterium]